MAHDFHHSVDATTASQEPREVPLTQDTIAASPEICVICLETISERAKALPCKHDCFDFPCLGNWLTKHKTCPLCKRDVEKLEYEFDGAGQSKIFYLPPLEPDEVSHSGPTHRSHLRRYSQGRVGRAQLSGHGYTGPDLEDDLGLERRRDVYRNQLLSLHVGSNRISRYQELNPRCFRDDEVLVSRAKKWIRRELQVFDFLNPDCADPGGDRHRAINAEFLLEYVVAVLKTTDIKGSGGHAQNLLKDFLGRDNARVFLHELQAWLRSPYHQLCEWDKAVQYDGSRQQQQEVAVQRTGGSKRTAAASSSSSTARQRWPPQALDRCAPNCKIPFTTP